MKKKVSILLFVGALAIITIFAVAHNAGANSGYRNAYDAAHGNPAGTTVCTFCHTSPPTLNATGQTLLASANPPGSTNFNYCSVGPATGTCATTVTAPVIGSFTATPASITSGSSSTLAWTLSGGAPTTLSIDNSVGSVLGTTSRSVSPTVTTTYTLTASNSAGSVTRSVTVTVTAAAGAPVIGSFTATPASITSGSSSTLAWTLSGGTPTTLSIDNSVGSVLGTTSRSVSPTVTTTYTLTASNSAGSVTRSVTVTVTAAAGAPVIGSFTATPASITSGSSSTLAWTLSGGAPTTLSIDNSVGSVLGTTSRSVSPTVTTTYTLTASNSAGNITRSVTVTVTPPDGAALYATNCAGCHNPLATSTKRGRTSAQILAAINNPSYPMSGLSGLTQAQIDAIATVLASTSDTTPPTVTAFSIPSTSGSLTVSITTFTATDNVGVAGYMVTESPSAPSASAAGWSTTVPTSYSCTTAGAKTLYAWAKDAAGNVSASRSAPVTITLTDNVPPTVTAFSIPATSSSRIVSITIFTATDNVAVTGYMVTESATPPSASATGWVIKVPPSYTYSTTGAKTLYAWAKDAAGNVSTSWSASTTITTPPPTSVDGAALYAANCVGCHGSLATSAKRGSTSAQILAAINNPSYPMSGLASLTTAQIDAIAAALSSTSDTTPPTVTAFSIPSTSSSLTVTITTFTATDNISVTGYMVTESATAPSASAAGWSATPPTSYTCSAAGAKTLYAWAKDAAGNVSASRSAPVAITLTDTAPPTVTTFSIPSTSSSLTVTITTFTATDNIGVTGYMVTESATAPSASAAGWSATPPTSYSCTTAGAKTFYAWAKDAAGNVSASRSAPVAITLTDTTPPTVTAFSIPSTSSSLTVTITTFTATDNIGVTGYMVTESATAPSASAAGWSATPPTSYTCSAAGAKTLYAWAKDAAGNVSASTSATVTITAQNPPPSPSPAIDLAAWSGQWFKLKLKYTGFSFGNSNSGRDPTNPASSSEDASAPGMSKDQQNIAVYLKLVSWDPNQGVLQGELHQFDSNSGQWVSDPVALHLIGGTPTDFLCWTQVNGDFTSGFVVRIQGKKKGSVLKSASLKTLGGYYFETNKGVSSNSPESLAGAISISGNLVPESKVPVPK